MTTAYLLHLRCHLGRVTAITQAPGKAGYHPHHARQAWVPSVNVYRYSDRFVVCAELAGVAWSEVELWIEPRRLRLSAHRSVLAPDGSPRKIHSMEIADGLCEREIALPADVVPTEAQADLTDGLLWITLPLRTPD